ncbi:MAG: D-aminoacylase [Burkholderiaceae bacterium]
MARHDLIFRNVVLIDGTGADRMPGDLAVTGDRISAMGDLTGENAGVEIDGGGVVLAPGFVDAHCHDDHVLFDRPLLEAKVSQGVTTVVNGNCGISLAPLPPGRPPIPQPVSLLSGNSDHFFKSFKDYFSALAKDPPAVNNVCLVGHSTLRHGAMDNLSRPADPAEIRLMTERLDEALEQGAIGLSTGLYYPTASAAPTEEVIAISQCLARHNGLYVTHMRDEADAIDASLEETFRIGREAGVAVVVSHHKCIGEPNHGRSEQTLAQIDTARLTQDVGLDVYPYVATSTILQADRVDLSSKVLITWSDSMPTATGRDLDEIAAELGCNRQEAARRLMPGGAIYFLMDEADVRRILRYEHTMVGSDGIVQDKHPHPRAWGTFPRVLGHYARDEKLFSLEQAVRKMTSLTARRFGLADRGELRVGAFADLVLFDPDTVRDTADFACPESPAAGIHQVYTNGRCIWRDQAATGERPGRNLRRVV